MRYIDLDKEVFTDPVDGTEYICYGSKLRDGSYKLNIECRYEYLFGLIGYNTWAEIEISFLGRYDFDFNGSLLGGCYNFTILGSGELERLVDLLNDKLTAIYYKNDDKIKLEFE